MLYSAVSEITPSVEAFAQNLAPGQRVTVIPVTPADDAERFMCHVNVRHRVCQFGGQQVLGWMFDEQANIYIEANAHSVWLKDGELIDITPHPLFDEHVIFVPDPNLEWNGSFIPSHHWSLHPDDPDIDSYIALLSKTKNPAWLREHGPYFGGVQRTLEGALTQIGITRLSSLLTLRYGDRSLHNKARSELKRMDEAEAYERARFSVTVPIRVNRVGRNDACPCGSGRKYKKCCGR